MSNSQIATSDILKIFSRIESTTLIAVLYRPREENTRVDLTSPEEILQAAVLPFTKATHLSPHKHNPVERQTVGTSEAWVVIRGSAEIQVFDLDDAVLGTWLLEQDALAISLKGGHALTSLQFGTLVYEFKNGPYWGPDVDKVQIPH